MITRDDDDDDDDDDYDERSDVNDDRGTEINKLFISQGILVGNRKPVGQCLVNSVICYNGNYKLLAICIKRCFQNEREREIALRSVSAGSTTRSDAESTSGALLIITYMPFNLDHLGFRYPEQ